MKRRTFIKSTMALSAAAATPAWAMSTPGVLERKYQISLNPGMIGVKANLAQTLDYAIKYGYEAISPFTNEVMESYSSEQLIAHDEKMKKHGISYCSANIPVEFRRDKDTFQEGFKHLKKFCQTMEKQGATRINTWIISSHSELTYMQNMKEHGERLGECAKVMKDHGIKLGLEYLGMRTMLNQNRYPFISSMQECRDLIAATGQDNVGFVLDSFHWYCANESLTDLRSVKPDEIVVVDVNDARKGLTRETQVDGKRELPLATGVIPLKDFMQGLVDIGYNGTIRTEPFNQELNQMDDEKALKLNVETLQKVISLTA